MNNGYEEKILTLEPLEFSEDDYGQDCFNMGFDRAIAESAWIARSADAEIMRLRELLQTGVRLTDDHAGDERG